MFVVGVAIGVFCEEDDGGCKAKGFLGVGISPV